MNNSLNNKFDNISDNEEEQLNELLQTWKTPDIENVSLSVINQLKKKRFIYRLSLWGTLSASAAAILMITFMPVKEEGNVSFRNTRQKQFIIEDNEKEEQNMPTDVNIYAGSKIKSKPIEEKERICDKPRLAANKAAINNTNISDAALNNIAETPPETSMIECNNNIEPVSLTVLNSITETE